MTKPRPKRGDEEVIDAAEPALRAMLAKCPFTEDEDGDSEGAINDAMEELRNIISFHAGDDGYELAKELERSRFCFSMSSEDVEELDQVRYLLSNALSVVEKEWVKNEGIVVPYELGQFVKFKSPRTGNVVEGEVIRIDADVAKLLVWVPSLGHVKTGVGTHGSLIPVEDVLGVCEPKEKE